MNSTTVIEDIASRLETVLGKPKSSSSIPLHEPEFQGNEWKYVKECLDTGWVSSVGSYVDRFEKDLERFTGAKKAVAVVNGTAALHLALKLVGVEKGDEVFVPAFTFIATANAVSYLNAVPHFIDIDSLNLGLSPVLLQEYLKKNFSIKDGYCFNSKTQRRVRALVVMHTFGHVSDVDSLRKVCDEYNIALVEDAAEALGSYSRGRHAGTMSDIGVLSFNGNKIVTTGGGGALLFNDEKLGLQAKHLSTTAKIPHPWIFEHDQVGYNYRLPNINAALGCAQLERLPSFLERKRALADSFEKSFKGSPSAQVFREPSNTQSNYWLNAVILESSKIRNEVIEGLVKKGFGVRPAWTLLHKLKMYKDCPRMDLRQSEELEQRLINLPSSPKLAASND
jgi:perosamine synthetase